MRWSLAALVATAWSTPAAANGDFLSRLATTARSRLDELAAARAPKAVPPVPVTVKWKAAKVGSLELGAPLVALGGADLDGDGKSELYAVTAREVVGITVRGTRVSELGRVAFGGDRAVPNPRDAVGTVTVERGELVAAASGWAKELRIALHDGRLTAVPGTAGFRVCPGERWMLAGGRNYFGTEERSDTGAAPRGIDGGPAYAARCRADLVDREGFPLRVRARLAITNKLTVEVQRCGLGGAPATCQGTSTFEYVGIGTTFDIADTDRDGTPEVIVSDDSAPGDADYVKVIALGGDERKGVFKKHFNGGVAGIATLDSDGDGIIEVIAAVRLAGATRVDLWRLN